MGDYEGGWSFKQTWNEEGIWSKFDAITILLIRFYWIVFIITIILGVLGGTILSGFVKKEGFRH